MEEHIPSHHIIESVLGHRSIRHSLYKTIAPEASIGHNHIKASQGTGHATVLSMPVRDDKALKL